MVKGRIAALAFAAVIGVIAYKRVVTLFRSGREGSCQKRDPGPGMRGKSERHGRSVRQVASRLRTHQEA
jgi:hypothetical protein